MSLSRTIATESLLIPKILREQRTLRLVGIIPSWTNFAFSEPWYDIEVQINSREAKKYRAWWIALYDLMRDEKDGATIQLILAYLIKEKARRSYSKEITVDPSKYKINEQHAGRVREHVLTHYESLNP